MTKPPVIGRPSQLDRIFANERHGPEYASPARTFSGETKEKRAEAQKRKLLYSSCVPIQNQ